MMAAADTASVNLSALFESSFSSLCAPGTSDPSATLYAWDVATAFLEPKTIDESNGELQPTQEVIDAINILHERGCIEDLLEWHRNQVSARFTTIIQPEIESIIIRYDGTFDVRALMVRLATYLQLWSQPHQALAAYIPSASANVSAGPVLVFRKHFLARLYPLITRQDVFDALREFLRSSVTLLTSELTSDVDESDNRSKAIETIRALNFLGLMERFEALTFGVVYDAIETRIAETAAGDFASSDVLSSLLDWLRDDIGAWMTSVYVIALLTTATANTTEAADRVEAVARAKASKMLRPAMQRFEWHIYSNLFRTRTLELFDIIVDYPDSSPAVQDLVTCLGKVDQRTWLVKSLTRQLKKRLLHPGADTKDILTQYIHMIRVMRILDPPGVLLAKVAGGMRVYLQDRSDTIRCIVQGMVEDGGELLEELRGAGDDGEIGPDSDATAGRNLLRERQEDEVESFADDGYKWTPTPIDAPADYSRNRTADIIQLLVSIYDTKELFVKELQHLLAARLLQIKDYDFSRELRNIEILKLRFGEAALSGLEVMLKDCADSKRVDTALHNIETSNPTAPAELHTTVISHLFWPTFDATSLKLPGQLAVMARKYRRAYSKLKPEKMLQWMPNMGSVSLTIELQDRTLALEVTPLQASVLELFSEKAVRTQAEIQMALGLTEVPSVKMALHFWQGKGVLGCLAGDAAEEELTWTIIETLPGDVPKEIVKAMLAPQAGIAASPLSNTPAVVTITRERLESMRPYYGLIRNVLTNLGNLPAQRLHSMLVSVAPAFKGHTLHELEAFLEAARTEGLLERTTKNEWALL